MTEVFTKRTIPLNPHRVSEETLRALEREVDAQHDDQIDVAVLDSFVLDTTEDGGLDSHATVFTDSNSDERGESE
jgi:hypothetical protein